MTDDPAAGTRHSSTSASASASPGAGGYDASFDALFATAYRVAFRVLGSREDADEVASEVMARAWVSWSRVEPYAPAWVARASGNLAISIIRRRSRWGRLPFGPDPAPVPQPDLRRDLVAALRRLPRRQREVLVLRYVADLPEREVAAVLHCSTGTVKQHAHRAVQALRADAQLSEEEV